MLAFYLFSSSAAAQCPCDAIGSFCNYAPTSQPCPRTNVCHGTTTPCGCDSCPAPASDPFSCAGCKPGPAPTPTPPAPPAPTPPAPPAPVDGKCQEPFSYCRCSCQYGDTALGSFACNCNAHHKALPADQQPNCCGGKYGFDAWCAKPAAAAKPTCSNQTTSGVPMPSSDFYEFGDYFRCVPNSASGGPCQAGFCDNPVRCCCARRAAPFARAPC
jgi:hypothetical protein